MEYFPRKSLSKYLTDTIDFNKHDIDIFINDKWRKYTGSDKATLQNYKATWTSLLTNEKAKSTFTRRLLCPNSPPTWALRLFFCLFSSGHCDVCPSIYGFWLPLWYLQALFVPTEHFEFVSYIMVKESCISFDNGTLRFSGIRPWLAVPGHLFPSRFTNSPE